MSLFSWLVTNALFGEDVLKNNMRKRTGDEYPRPSKPPFHKGGFTRSEEDVVDADYVMVDDKKDSDNVE